MSDISVEQLYALYMDTLSRCSSGAREKGDEQIEYDLFEEFDVGVHSFLHENSLAKLREAGYINDGLVRLSLEVRRKALSLQERKWTLEDVRQDAGWASLFELVDRVLKLNDTGRDIAR
jgi:hypothetical protein